MSCIGPCRLGAALGEANQCCDTRPYSPALPKVAAGLALIATVLLPGSALAGPSQIIKVSGTNLDCSLVSPDATADLTAITRDRTDGNGFAFIDLGILPNDPAKPLISGGMDDPPLTPTGIHTTFDMAIDATGELVGSATVAATFTLTGRQRFRAVSQNGVQKGVFNDLSVVGTITATSGATSYTFDMADCVASTLSRMDQIHDPNGPKPGGAVPANDTSSGALPVAPGSQVHMQTGGASPDPETPCLVTFDDQVFEFGWGRTVWFTLKGTGGPITIDPGGSNFDTVVAAYVSAGAGLRQIACVDDNPSPISLQGRATIDTQLGATYLIQIGGVVGDFGSDSADFGRLRLSDLLAAIARTGMKSLASAGLFTSSSDGPRPESDRLEARGAAILRWTAGVPPRGFEPLISTLKGWRPRPLDDGGMGRPESTRGSDRAPTRVRAQAGGRETRKPISAPARNIAPMMAAMPPTRASPIARPFRPSTPARQTARNE